MATLLWQRDISSDLDGVKSTYSSWDSCMTKAYCKWPAIVGIIIGSLIVFSLVWCLARCLCCGAECCCGCLACCNACCPSPRGRKGKDGYQPAPPPQQAFQPYQQYQSAQPPVYASGALGGYKSTATFDAPSRQGNTAAAKYNEDALPVMPSWENGTNRHVETEDVEMEKMNHVEPQQQQQQSLLRHNDDSSSYSQQQYGQPQYDHQQYGQPQYAQQPYGQQQHSQQQYHQRDAQAGDLGAMQANPYHDYSQNQQYVTSPTSTARTSAYPPTYRTSATSTVYEPAGQQQQWGGYAASVAPSYNTGPVNPQIGRKAVPGTWREG